MQTSKFNKILVINNFGIGDVLFTTPLITNLKELFPQSKIGYLCNQRALAVLENNPRIDKLHVYERDDFDKIRRTSQLGYVRALFKFWDEIKKEKYDCVFDVSLTSLMSYFSAWAGIPCRVGYNYKNRSPLLTKRIDFKGYEGRAVAEHYLDLLRSVGLKAQTRKLELYVSQQDEDFANEIFVKNGIGEYKTVIGLVPGGGASWGRDAQYKRWPVENYVKLADKIVEKTKAAFILFGDKSETELCLHLAQSLKGRCFNLCGQTTVRQMAALAQKCQLVIANDGGPLHICVAAGAKTCSIFGPVDDLVYGPYPRAGHIVVTKDIPCRPCYRQFRRSSCEHLSCLRSLTALQVYEKIVAAIS